jgi:hypothetical protein
MQKTRMFFGICNWFSLELHFHHILERLNICHIRSRQYEFHRYELDHQRPQSRWPVLTDRWFWSASTSQYLKPYADPHLLSQTLPPVSRGSSPCQLTKYQLEHIKTVAQPNRLIALTPDNKSYFLSEDTELADEWQVAMQYSPQQPQSSDPSLDAAPFGLSSAFANLSVNYERVLADTSLIQQLDDAISCRVCRKTFKDQPKLKYVAGFIT